MHAPLLATNAAVGRKPNKPKLYGQILFYASLAGTENANLKHFKTLHFHCKSLSFYKELIVLILLRGKDKYIYVSR